VTTCAKEWRFSNTGDDDMVSVGTTSWTDDNWNETYDRLDLMFQNWTTFVCFLLN